MSAREGTADIAAFFGPGRRVSDCVAFPGSGGSAARGGAVGAGVGVTTRCRFSGRRRRRRRRRADADRSKGRLLHHQRVLALDLLASLLGDLLRRNRQGGGENKAQTANARKVGLRRAS